MELMESVNEVKLASMMNKTDLEAEATAQTTLMGDLAPVSESIVPLYMSIEELMMADDPFGANSTLIADYFTINEEQIDLPEFESTLGEFCVAAGQVLKFDLSANVKDDSFRERANYMILLLVDEQPVAEAEL